MSNSSGMQRFGRGLKAAAKAFGKNPVHYAAAGKQITCPHCGGAEFEGRKVLLNTRGATLFNMDWLDQGSVALVCRACSRIEWFREEPAVLD